MNGDNGSSTPYKIETRKGINAKKNYMGDHQENRMDHRHQSDLVADQMDQIDHQVDSKESNRFERTQWIPGPLELKMITVRNMSNEASITMEATPREAVVAAYALSRGDASTWLYERYDSMVEETSALMFCGEWSVRK